MYKKPARPDLSSAKTYADAIQTVNTYLVKLFAQNCPYLDGFYSLYFLDDEGYIYFELNIGDNSDYSFTTIHDAANKLVERFKLVDIEVKYDAELTELRIDSWSDSTSIRVKFHFDVISWKDIQLQLKEKKELQAALDAAAKAERKKVAAKLKRDSKKKKEEEDIALYRELHARYHGKVSLE